MSRTLSAQIIQKIGQNVTLSGWVNSRRDHGGVIFIDIRDHTGIVQLTIHPEKKEAFSVGEKLRDEFVIGVQGTVIERAPELVNPNLPTGTVEVVVETITVLNTSKPLPFQIAHSEDQTISEDIRLQYRFLDLRRDKMQRMLVKRHKMIKFIRDWMDAKGFIEITTPILTSSSPEGARDFLVPSRLHPGKFYALPQAPQQYKQLLMVGGIAKYFQIAPCFRDEDPRADRSPGEFYQMDCEIAFADKDETIFNEFEPLFVGLTEDFAGKQCLKKPFPRIPYLEAMEKYGSDRPDLRFGMELVELTNDLSNTEFSVFNKAIQSGGCVKAICCHGGSTLTRSQIDELTEFVKKEGAGGLAYIIVDRLSKDARERITSINFHAEDIEGLKSPIIKFLSPIEVGEIIKKLNADEGDIIFFGADERTLVNKVLGKLRSELADKFDLKDPNIIAWAWITDFPMYELDKEGKLDFTHNPFSMPQGGMDALTNTSPLEIKSYQYDIVANGLELSSGAIRNFHPDIMYKVFELVGYTKEVVNEKFGGMIRAFEYGAPPHGGFAPGVDRLLMVLENESNIREVIAFPKNGSAEDVMMGAPGTVEEKQLKELHIKLDGPEKQQH